MPKSLLSKIIVLLLTAVSAVSCILEQKSPLQEATVLSEKQIHNELYKHVFENVIIDTLPKKYYNLDHNSKRLFSHLFEAVRLYEEDQQTEALQVINHCFNKLEHSKFGPETCLILGKLLDEKDMQTSVILLQKALKVSIDGSDKNNALQYCILSEIITILVDHTVDEVGDAINLEMDSMVKDYSQQAYNILQSDSTFSEKSASKSALRISAESILWLGEKDLAHQYIRSFRNPRKKYDDFNSLNGYVSALKGVEAFIDANYVLSKHCFQQSIDTIGHYKSFINYDLELPYAYISEIDYIQGDYDHAIDYIQRSIKCLHYKNYETINDPIVTIAPSEIQNRKSLVNLILSHIRLQRIYKQSLLSGSSTVTLGDLEGLSFYTNMLIKGWFTRAADNNTLLYATRFLKQSNAELLDALYAFSNEHKICFDIATEASAFNLNYLKSLKVPENKDQSQLTEQISQLSLSLLNENKSETNDQYEIERRRLKLLLYKNQLNKEIEVVMDSIESNMIYKNIATNENQLALKYFQSNQHYYVCYKTSDKEGIVRLNQKKIDEIESIFLRKIKSGDNITTTSRQMYDLLIDPIKTILPGKTEITIITEERKKPIPFALLQNDEGKYLIEDFQIEYAYSPKALEHSNKSSINIADRLLAVAPGFGFRKKQVHHHIAQSSNPKTSIRNNKQLAPLPHSIKEVKVIKKYANTELSKTTLFTSEEGTKANFIRAAQNYDIIHIATHAVSNQEHNSGLFFYPTTNDDGFLSLKDLYHLRLHANLVVLSGCKTSLGKVKPGEGIMALPRGFLFAGAKNIIASLWSIHDRESSKFMDSFYKILMTEKCSYSKALQQAKIQALKAGTLPVDWSGFIFIRG